ncbi:hypothetical protein BOO24_20170 [Vibrio navarrensis]|uniref:hypothetical protein n=1 Tax=Vibrio navarrensis TaxID=29495 RepID=UPI00186ABBA0|nr:hypothetical protein [Vibrio navarrensis]MBE4594649.1 hypothetical protein [Vibrio navarrensis]
MYQQKYWSLLKELKTHSLYIQNFAIEQSRIEQTLNIILAITSSTSIAAWAIWKDYAFVWGVIIAFSQIITAVKPILPYKKRLDALNALDDSIAKLSLVAERDWYYVAEGQWTEHDIHTKWAELREKSLAAEKKCLGNLTLPRNKKALKQAESQAELYFTSTYDAGVHNE